jgi:signal transduction histidine kinase
MLLSLEERARGFDRLTLLQETATGFAHEIGTPLNTLSGHLQLLRDDLALQQDDAGVNRIRLLLDQVDRMAGIVRAALERGSWPRPSLQRVDLTEISSRMLLFLEPAFTDAGVTARLQSSRAVFAACDPGMVEQILLNLLKNAIEALGPGNQVQVTTAAQRDQAVIEISDDGPGLDREAESRLFQPFSTTKGTHGTGLGLAVSRRLARTLCGDLVHVPSSQGVRWRLALPAAEPA